MLSKMFLNALRIKSLYIKGIDKIYNTKNTYTLNLDYSNEYRLNENDLNSLFSSLKENSSINGIKFSFYEITNLIALSLTKFIKNNPNIEFIDLLYCNFNELNEDSLNALFNAFKNSTSLQQVSLKGSTLNNAMVIR